MLRKFKILISLLRLNLFTILFQSPIQNGVDRMELPLFHRLKIKSYLLSKPKSTNLTTFFLIFPSLLTSLILFNCRVHTMRSFLNSNFLMKNNNKISIIQKIKEIIFFYLLKNLEKLYFSISRNIWTMWPKDVRYFS